jgi:hypothetical protein
MNLCGGDVFPVEQILDGLNGLPGIKKQRRRCGAQRMRRVDALLNFLA